MGLFSCNGVGPLVKIVGNMDANYYVCNILEAVMLPYAEEEMPLRGVFSKRMSQSTRRKKQMSGFDPTKLTF